MTNVEVLQYALKGYEHELAQIDEHIAELRAQLDGRTRKPVALTAAHKGGRWQIKKKRVLSASARKRIADAQRQRWAKFHAQKAAAVPLEPKVRRRQGLKRPAKLNVSARRTKGGK